MDLRWSAASNTQATLAAERQLSSSVHSVLTTSSMMVYAVGADDSPTRWCFTVPTRNTPFSLNTHCDSDTASCWLPDCVNLQHSNPCLHLTWHHVCSSWHSRQYDFCLTQVSLLHHNSCMYFPCYIQMADYSCQVTTSGLISMAAGTMFIRTNFLT